MPIVIDGTPSYIKFPERVHKIYKRHGLIDQLRIVISLREPVSREISSYTHLAALVEMNKNYSFLSRV